VHSKGHSNLSSEWPLYDQPCTNDFGLATIILKK
jgi:hypothetical protein